jgi:Na+-transporting NADH:ubiquinone oxidoreductase subunit NqrB
MHVPLWLLVPMAILAVFAALYIAAMAVAAWLDVKGEVFTDTMNPSALRRTLLFIATPAVYAFTMLYVNRDDASHMSVRDPQKWREAQETRAMREAR